MKTIMPRANILLSSFVGVVVLIFIPYFIDSYGLGIVVKILIFALFAISLGLLVGYAGLPSLGHAAYFGFAAYTAALLARDAGWGFWLSTSAALVGSALLAAVFSTLALRTRGAYFLMITMALSQIVWGTAVGWRTVTGGNEGVSNIPRPQPLPWFSVEDGLGFYYFVCVVVCGAILLIWRITASPFGYVLRGVRDSEARMLALGYPVRKIKVMAFVLSAVFAGLAGVLYAYFNRFVSPEYLQVQLSAEALLMVIVGGAGTLIGPAIGAGAIILLETVASTYTERWVMILGVVYVLVALFAPNGMIERIKRLFEKGGRG